MKHHSILNKLFFVIAVLALPGLAAAHTGSASGLLHPLTGLDHILAMLSVGVWAAYVGGRSRWALPSAFVGFMLLGFMVGSNGVTIPFVETGIVASVIVLGLLVAFGVRLPVLAGMALVGLFAVFHGVAHGIEWSSASSAMSYSLGFVFTTLMLHLAGIAIGSALSKDKAPGIRLVGLAVAVVGLSLVFV